MVALSGCGDDAKKEDPLAAAAGFCDAWSKYACNKDVVDKCSEEPDVDKCVVSQTDFCLGLVDSDEYVKKGAEECLGAVKKAYSDTRITAEEAQVVLRLQAPCDRILGGGEPSCKSEGDCADYEDTSCEKPAGASVGTCVIDGGYDCKSDELSCASEFYCDEDKNCVRRLEEDETCTADSECVPELKCVVSVDDPEVSVCAPRKETGEACKAHDDCQSHFCANNECTSRVDLNTLADLCDDLS